MRDNVSVYRYQSSLLTAVLGLLLTAALFLLFVGLTDIAFQKIGLTRLQFALILIFTFIGSYVNIPVWEVRNRVRFIEIDEVRAFWITYRVPRIVSRQFTTTIAVNLGGAVIPTIVSAYLLFTHRSVLLPVVAATLLTAIGVHLFARKVSGVGIVTPAFLPPILAAAAALLLVPGDPFVAAYVSGTMGALIGADLTNLRGMGEVGAKIASIGGAGKFDGVFLTGIIAVLLVALV